MLISMTPFSSIVSMIVHMDSNISTNKRQILVMDHRSKIVMVTRWTGMTKASHNV